VRLAGCSATGKVGGKVRLVAEQREGGPGGDPKHASAAAGRLGARWARWARWVVRAAM
jgi:hypothetical protein